ncbi:MAG: electron transfer flavoprotein subunit alpha/FixB family protein [candidate division Zixibacteria bacterium]|nr:electron transfer flavoprotein subunit alpha/FixB family protein [candidate division Zixibacteria bacterium]
MPGIWIIAEHKEGRFKKITFELLSLGKKIKEKNKEEICTLLLGSNIENLTPQLGPYGAEKVFLLEDEILKDYTNESYTRLIVDLARTHNPSILLGGATAQGKDLLPRVAARLNTGLASDCVNVEIQDDGLLRITRPVYAGKVLMEVVIPDSKPQMAAVRPNIVEVLPRDDSQKAEVIKCKPDMRKDDLKSLLKEVLKGESKKIDITEADIIVSGGRGMKARENFKILEELADAFGEGTAVGASRAAVDSDFAPHDIQVGQTGKVVNPTLYIACGISGSIQHLAGMSTSKYIVAINKDPDAPIFQKADYGIVGDLFEVVPLLTGEVKKLKAEG